MFPKISVLAFLASLSVSALGQTTETPRSTIFPPIEETIVDAGLLGKIQGTYSLLSRPRDADRDHYMYYTGIPYALPESYTEDNRFKPSKVYNKPLTDDGSIFDANRPFIWCPQAKLIDLPEMKSHDDFNFTDILSAAKKRRESIRDPLFPGGDGYMGSEECLTLTVSTTRIQRVGEPELDPSELMPVILFFHGGGFNQFWGSVFGGHRLLNRDVVFVSINYRLGILGSLNYGTDDAPGNALLYDCLTSLDWVKRYIKHFGGDPNRVTVTGESAGAVLSTAVFLSPMANGLIQGAVGDSGSAYSIWGTNLTPMDDHIRFATFTPTCKHFVQDPINEEEIDFAGLTACMKGLTLGELVKAQEDYSYAENLVGRMGYDALVPSIQSDKLNIDRCIKESPAEVLKHQRQANASLMMGVMRHDGSFVFDTTYHNFLQANGHHLDMTFIRNEFLPTFLKGVGLIDTTGALLHGLMNTYVGDAAHSNDFNTQIPGILDIHTVIGFKSGAYGLVEQHSKLNPNSYYYAFDYKGMWSTSPFSFTSGSPIPGGVAHADDLIYLFQLFPLISEEDINVSKRYVEYWVNFATYGNPNGPGDLNEPFPRYSGVDHPFLIINGTDKAGKWCRDTWIKNAKELM